MVDPKEFASFVDKVVSGVATLKAEIEALKAEREALRKQLDDALGKVLPPELLERLRALVASLESHP